MGLEVAELAALRPIQTTAVSGAMATAGRADAAAADDAGCVTPTASRERAEEDGAGVDGNGIVRATPTPPLRDGGADDDASYATPMLRRTTSPLQGCEFEAVTAAACGDAAVDFTTPTSEESALKPATVCPPAPRKRKLAPLQQRLFFPVPLDLATVFKPAPPPPEAKKMRAHAVESPLPLGT